MSKCMRGAMCLCALVTLPLAGCAGGAGGAPLGGIDGGGIAKGTVTGFGSIFVNGVEYSTSGATITVDGRPGTQADLAVGDVVSIVGRIDANGTTGTAVSVTFDDDVEGPVQSVDVANDVLIVLGQTVHVSGTTSFGDGTPACTLAGLQPGNVVEVSGFRDSFGDIEATRIECKQPGGELEVTGNVQSLDANLPRFQIGTLTVDYSQAQLLGFPGGQPAAQQTVEAKGSGLGNGVLLASRVELKDARIAGKDGDSVELEGLITRFVSATDFDISGQRATTSANTRYESCGATFNPPLNAKVEVEGALAAGAVLADEIECSAGAELRVRAPVETVSSQSNTFTVLGITISATDTTRLEDKSGADLSPFNLGDLRAGDLVEVRGASDAQSGSMIAALLERHDPEPGVELRGTASVTEPDLIILGVTARTGASTAFEDENETPISAAEFFARAAGRLVEVRGSDLGGVVVVEEAQLEE